MNPSADSSLRTPLEPTTTRHTSEGREDDLLGGKWLRFCVPCSAGLWQGNAGKCSPFHIPTASSAVLISACQKKTERRPNDTSKGLCPLILRTHLPTGILFSRA